MPQQAASGLWGTPVMALARLLASSATFRAVCAAANAADAIERHIWWLEVEDDEEDAAPLGEERLVNARPRAIIDWADSWQTVRAGSGTWTDSGGLVLSFEFVPPKEYSGQLKEEALWFLNKVGSILDEMRTNSGGADASGNPYLNAHSFATLVTPGRCVRSENVEHFWDCSIQVAWPT